MLPFTVFSFVIYFRYNYIMTGIPATNRLLA